MLKHTRLQHLELAAVNLERLAIDNHQLRQQLDQAHRVTNIAPETPLVSASMRTAGRGAQFAQIVGLPRISRIRPPN